MLFPERDMLEIGTERRVSNTSFWWDVSGVGSVGREVGEPRFYPMPESRAARGESPKTEAHIIRAFVSRAASQSLLTTLRISLGISAEIQGAGTRRVV